MNLPRNHHFKPVFFLSRWLGKDQRLCETRFIRGKIARRREFPQNTGCVKDLYRTDGVPLEKSQDLETGFMTSLDTKAALALNKYASQTELRPDERAAWAKFLLSLLYRNPDCVRFLKTHMADLVRKATATLEAHWATHRMPDEHRSLAEATADRQPGYAEISAANIIKAIIGGHRAEPDIVNMHWTCIDLSQSNIPLMTSDRPLVFGNLSDPTAYISLPIGPRDLFVAAFDDRFARWSLPMTNPTQVAWTSNKDVVSQARQFVWGVDDGQIDFVRTYIGSVPDRVIMSEAQLEESRAAARELPPG
jgi:Protein of unknown function (DUF4238)